MIKKSELKEIVLRAVESTKDSLIDWIETEQLFINLYGDTYLEVKNQLIAQQGNLR